jgi:hypothetical protein
MGGRSWRGLACRRLAGVAACAGIVLAGCGGGNGNPVPASRTPTASLATAVRPSPTASLSWAQVAERDALAAYRGMWEDWIAVAATSDYQNPMLTRHVSGEALSLIYRSVYANKRDGLVARGRPTFSGRVSAAEPAEDPDRVTVKDCSDGSRWLNYKLNGQLQNTTPGGRHSVQALVVKNTGTWKVNVLVIQPVGTC